MQGADFSCALSLAHKTATIRAALAVAGRRAIHADLDDLVQEGVIACWKASRQFDPARAGLRTFLDRVVALRFATVLRSERRKPRTVDLDASVHPQTPDEGRAIEFSASLQTLLKTLSHEDAHLVKLLLHFTPAEAARVLGVARSTIHDRIRRLRPKFLAAGLVPAGYSGIGRAE
ncbi:MAG TPA: sigma-70 family RNA polymerase sigma factor [Bryobacteraceae bacterium]|nr:sigma-70 family RNA polymerase sigma factor [Bryobacteraceae bacterium]